MKMPKAILELEMPESCFDCDFSMASHYKKTLCCMILCRQYESKNAVECADKGRRPDCPLKLVDDHCRKADWMNGKCRGYQVSR
jgi:hypothetical protein